MSTGTLIFLLLTVGAVVWMFSMRRGGHGHSGLGCCGALPVSKNTVLFQ